MRNRSLAIAALIAVFAAVAVYGAVSKASQYVAALSGAKEVPPVTTKAKGEAIFAMNSKATAIDYTLTVSGLPRPTGAHIHLGAPGKNGPVVAVLYPTPGTATRKGNILAKGVIAPPDLVGPLQGKPLSALLKAVRAGNAYVNVHSAAHPDGEIRGWITAKPEK